MNIESKIPNQNEQDFMDDSRNKSLMYDVSSIESSLPNEIDNAVPKGTPRIQNVELVQQYALESVKNFNANNIEFTLS